jgi:hypothetical protein
MTPAEFVGNWRRQKEKLLGAFMEEDSETLVAQKIRSLGLSSEQTAALREVLDGALTDTMYSLLLGLDGAASIGDDQQRYKIFAEDGSLMDEIDAEAYAQFHLNT